MKNSDAPSKQSSLRVNFILLQALLLWFIASLSYAHQYLMRTSLATLSKSWSELLHINPELLGWLAAGYFYVYLIMQPIAGILIDIFNTRKIMIVASITVAISCFLMAISTSFETLLATRILSGLGGAFSLA